MPTAGAPCRARCREIGLMPREWPLRAPEPDFGDSGGVDPRLAGQARGLELPEHLVEIRRLPAKGFGDLPNRPLYPDLGECHSTVALGQPRPVLVEYQRDVRICQRRVTQEPRQVR